MFLSYQAKVKIYKFIIKMYRLYQDAPQIRKENEWLLSARCGIYKALGRDMYF
jgi:hypothetical protein